MLVGLSVTLGELEKHMEERLSGLQMETNRLYQEAQQIKRELEQSGERDEKYNKKLEKYKKIIEELDEKNETIEFLKMKLEEAEQDKDKEKKIYLTLKDCLTFGIEPRGVNYDAD